MEFKDYYELMGVSREATQDTIKRAYRKLARKYHPDVSKEADAEEQFKAIGEAYEVLKDPEKRAAYDQLGQNWQAGQDFHPPPDWDAGFEFSGGGFTGGGSADHSDFFESLFGRGFQAGDAQGRGFHARGDDHHAKVLIELEDAFSGATRSMTLQTPAIDHHGRVSTHARTLNVRIPKGVHQGQQIRLGGQGSPGFGEGSAGDLYLEIEFQPHRLYRAEGRDLYLTLPITPWEAALGAKVTAPTPGGNVGLKLPAGSESGRKLRLKGRGIPGREAGDLYVELQIVVPPANDEKTRELYQRMQQELDFDPRASLAGDAA